MSISRSLLNGESLFTSVGVLKGRIPGWSLHLDRLYRSVNSYFFKGRLSFTDFIEYFDLAAPSFNTDGYFRVSFFSEVPVGDRGIGLCDLVLRTDWHDRPQSRKNLDLALRESPFTESVSQFKAGSYFESFWARSMSKSDDVLFVRDGQLLEASTSCLVLKKGHEFYTPKFSGALESISLSLFEAYCQQQGFKLEKEPLPIKILKEFDAAYLINCVQYLQSIHSIENMTFEVDEKLPSQFLDFLESQ